jgi:hypothetical protein
MAAGIEARHAECYGSSAMDWQRRLLEIGLAGGLASGALACEQQPCINCACEQKHVSTLIDTAGGSGPVPIDAGADGPKVWAGCAVPESSPPAAYGPLPNSGGMCPSPTPSMPLYYQPVSIDDDSLGYSAADVLNVVNNSKVGDLLWMDGTRTKLRFSAQLAAYPGFPEVSVLDPGPGGCRRSLQFDIVATLTSDDGRLNETLPGCNVITYDQGGPFDINHVLVVLGSLGNAAPVARDTGDAASVTPDAGDAAAARSGVGTIRSVIPPLLGLTGDADIQYSVQFVLKGATCSDYCEPGQMPPNLPAAYCFRPSGLIIVSATGPDYSCISANVASWEWE